MVNNGAFDIIDSLICFRKHIADGWKEWGQEEDNINTEKREADMMIFYTVNRVKSDLELR